MRCEKCGKELECEELTNPHTMRNELCYYDCECDKTRIKMKKLITFYTMSTLRKETEEKLKKSKGNKPMEDRYKSQLKAINKYFNIGININKIDRK